jgi:hypothetical protein
MIKHILLLISLSASVASFTSPGFADFGNKGQIGRGRQGRRRWRNRRQVWRGGERGKGG